MPLHRRGAIALALVALIALPAVVQAIDPVEATTLASSSNPVVNEGFGTVTWTGEFTFTGTPAAPPITISPTLAAKFNPQLTVGACAVPSSACIKWTFTYSAVDDLAQLMTVTATDTSSNMDADTFTATVNNVVPAFSTRPPGGAQYYEGYIFAADIYDADDPGAGHDPLVFEIDCGDGSGFKTISGTGTPLADFARRQCTVNGDGGVWPPYAAGTAKFRVSDGDGGVTTDDIDFSIYNSPPTAMLGAPLTVVEGSTFLLTLTNATDPSVADQAAGFAFAFWCDSGFGGLIGVSALANESTWVAPDTKTATSASKSCAAMDGPATIWSLGAVADKDRLTDLPESQYYYSNDVGWWASSRYIAVTNARPGVGTPAFSRVSRKKVNASLSFTDAGILDTHTCDIDWGDGATSTGTVTETNGAGTCTGQHKYARRGRYVVNVTITDSDGGERNASARTRVPIRR